MRRQGRPDACSEGAKDWRHALWILPPKYLRRRLDWGYPTETRWRSVRLKLALGRKSERCEVT